jgi:hypothetical protein
MARKKEITLVVQNEFFYYSLVASAGYEGDKSSSLVDISTN